MGWVTLLGFPLLALLLLYFIADEWQFIFTGGWPLYYQIPLGIALGVGLGFGLREFLKTQMMRDITHKYAGMLGEFSLNKQEIIFLSVCAGIGEEILFRGCIQYFAGVYITSVGFVALHGYLNPMDRRVFIYGIILTIIFFGVGFLMQFTGIYTCIILHIIIDIILFDHLIGDSNTKN